MDLFIVLQKMVLLCRAKGTRARGEEKPQHGWLPVVLRWGSSLTVCQDIFSQSYTGYDFFFPAIKNTNLRRSVFPALTGFS